MDRRRILLVDDDVAVARSLASTLERVGGYEVRTESEGRRAAASARAFRPDLILLDVIMPGMDGGDIAARMEQDPALKDVPIAFLTGLVSEEELGPSNTDSRGRRLIPKPIDPDELLAVVRELLPG